MDSPQTPVEAPRRTRLWPAFGIPFSAVGASLLAWLYSPVIMILWILFTLLGCVAWLLWIFRYSRLSRKGQLSFLLLPILIVAVLVAVLRVDYFDGNTIPVFVWRWDEVPVVDVQIKDSKKGKTVDLVTTTALDVPEFLGVGRVPVFKGVNLDPDWTKSPPKELWRQPIGEGYGSFAVVGEYAVTQQQREDEELVVCYHWPTGEARWGQNSGERQEKADHSI
ncbi:MAG: hypothetical protein P1V97_23555 [Planctomycetota bacterium]|nr:hypothetical protein [Planctomycetota bacterium]